MDVPPAVVVSLSVLGVVAISGTIVSFDPRHRPKVTKLLEALVPSLVALPLLAATWWLYAHDFEPLGGLGTKYLAEAGRLSNEGSAAFFKPWLLAPIAGLADILITVAIVGATAAAVVIAAGRIVIELPTLLAVVGVAIAHIGYGLLAILSLPFTALRGLAMLVTRPRGVREIRHTLTKTRGPGRDTKVASVLKQEAVRATQRERWWKPFWWQRLKTRHYRDLAAHLDSLSRTADAAREHLERDARDKGGPR